MVFRVILLNLAIYVGLVEAVHTVFMPSIGMWVQISYWSGILFDRSLNTVALLLMALLLALQALGRLQSKALITKTGSKWKIKNQFFYKLAVLVEDQV